jgi:hypothetical protein
MVFPRLDMVRVKFNRRHPAMPTRTTIPVKDSIDPFSIWASTVPSTGILSIPWVVFPIKSFLSFGNALLGTKFALEEH